MPSDLRCLDKPRFLHLCMHPVWVKTHIHFILGSFSPEFHPSDVAILLVWSGILTQIMCLVLAYRCRTIGSMTFPMFHPRTFYQYLRHHFWINGVFKYLKVYIEPSVSLYLLGLLAMIKCSICSYQCDNWYVSNWRLDCHIYFCWGSIFLSLLKGLHVLCQNCTSLVAAHPSG